MKIISNHNKIIINSISICKSSRWLLLGLVLSIFLWVSIKSTWSNAKCCSLSKICRA